MNRTSSKAKAQRAAIIGSGVGGLATAVRLAHRGFEVTVYEQNQHPGGKVSPVTQDGFFWGFGASLFTYPELLDHVFTTCGRQPSDYYHYQRLDPVCRYFYADGTRLDAFAAPERFADEIQNKTGEPREHILNHLKKIAAVFETTKDVFLFQALHKWRTYASMNTMRSMLRLGSIGIMSNMHSVNQKTFRDPRVVQLFDRYATYNGSDPYLAPSTLNVIAHLEYNMGAYFLDGGMPDLTASLYKLALEMGVRFEFGAAVDGITVRDGKACAVTVSGTERSADVVVSNMDVVYTYRKLMPAQPAPERSLQQERSTSAIVFYWGMKAEFPELDMHNIFFAEDYAAEFGHLTNKKMVGDDPTTYVFISSKKQKAHAPAGCENWFVLINAPHDAWQDWDKVVADTRRQVIAKLSKQLGRDIAPLIVSEMVNHPASIQSKTQSYLGALYGSSSNDIFSAFLRHPNFSSQIKDLYFCGGSVHPGGGVPLCLLSAKIIDELIAEI